MCCPVSAEKRYISFFFLHILFNIRLETGLVLSAWNKCIINPIPKSSQSDPRDPNNACFFYVLTV